jgi:hypothetical protein
MLGAEDGGVAVQVILHAWPGACSICACNLSMVLLLAGKPGTKRDLDGNAVPQKRSKATAAVGGGGDAMDVSLPSPTLSAPARQGERVWHSDEHTVFVKGMGYQVKEEDLRQLFGGLAVRAVRMGLDRETGQARVSYGQSTWQ